MAVSKKEREKREKRKKEGREGKGRVEGKTKKKWQWWHQKTTDSEIQLTVTVLIDIAYILSGYNKLDSYLVYKR
jgi:uncharacterized membrane protein YkvA (DUF1232 family)